MRKNNHQSGFVLITSTLILAGLLLLGSYLITMASSDAKISQAQFLATKNYYLAEAGINEMIYKIQNDATTREAFIQGTLSSSDNINRTNIFNDSNAGYAVSAENTIDGEAWITVTSTYQIGNNQSQRVVKAYITMPDNSTPAWDFGLFAGGRGGQQNGNFNFTGAGIVLVANNCRLHANQVFKVQGAEVVVNNGSVTSSNVINIVAGGKLTLNNSYQQSPTSTVDMLQIDFDSTDPMSWKNRATVTYAANQFKNLPNNTVLTGIIYVNGNAQLTGKNLTINGVLVANGSIDITTAGRNLLVNKHSTYGGGLLSKGNLKITSAGGNVTVNGLVYSGNTLDITSAGTVFVINGAMAGFDSRVTASGGAITLNFTPENFNNVVDPQYNVNAPLIEIDHWEEQY